MTTTCTDKKYLIDAFLREHGISLRYGEEDEDQLLPDPDWEHTAYDVAKLAVTPTNVDKSFKKLVNTGISKAVVHCCQHSALKLFTVEDGVIHFWRHDRSRMRDLTELFCELVRIRAEN